MRKKDVTFMQSGVKVTLSPEEYEIYKEKTSKKVEVQKEDVLDIEAINKELNDNIRTVLKTCDDRMKRKVLLGLLDVKVSNEDELDYKIWLFDAGNLRTNEEVLEYDYNIKLVKYRKNYNRERHLINLAGFFVPFIAVFGIILFLSGTDDLLFTIPLGLIPAGIAGTIGGMIATSINISNAKEYGLSEYDPRVQAEVTKLRAGLISSAVGTYSTVRHTKQAIKDFANVETWKEFK